MPDAEREAQIRRRHSPLVSSHPCDEKDGWTPSPRHDVKGCEFAFLLRLLDEARAEIAQLRAPPEADVMELAWRVWNEILEHGMHKGAAEIIARALTEYGDQRAAAERSECLKVLVAAKAEREAYGDQRAREARRPGATAKERARRAFKIWERNGPTHGNLEYDVASEIEQAAREAHAAAIEEAAQLAERWPTTYVPWSKLAPAIRALADAPPQSADPIRNPSPPGRAASQWAGTQQQPGWRPIETAPKDETVFIATTAGDDWVFLCAWWPVKNPSIANWVRCDGKGDGEPHVRYCGDDPGSDAWWVEPTHWMPLPEPPKLDEGGDNA